MRWKSLLLSLLLLGLATRGHAQDQKELNYLQSLQHFIDVFNRDQGRSRLVLLLSPT